MVPLQIKLPEHFLDEEVRDGFTVTRQIKELWAIEIDLLFQLDRICKKYNLRYFADGGTLLGAFRHQGYMHEAISFCDQRIFESGIHRIEAYVLPSNQHSIDLLQGLGYEREGLLHDKAFLNGKYIDDVLLAHIKDTD